MRRADLRWLIPVSLLLVFSSYMVACQPTSNVSSNTPSAIKGDSAQSSDVKTSSPPAATANVALAVESVDISEITESSARITWRTTTEAIGQVEYGKTSDYGFKRPLESQLYSQSSATGQSIVLKELEANTTYHLRVRSKDVVGNEAISKDITLTTLVPVGCQIGNRPPDFTLKDLDGGDVTLSNFFGKRMLVFFWADD